MEPEIDTPTAEQSSSTEIFTAEQARVFACLTEKNLATPNSYPLTVNSLMLACNQKTNREPVMSLSEGDVGHIAQKLSERGYVSIEYGQRANKLFHKAGASLGLKREEQAVMAMLMLRVPMTLSDIKARTERMVKFADLEAVKTVVEGLIERDTPLVKLLPKGNGRREDRYAHLLCGDVDISSEPRAPRAMPVSDMQQQIDALQARIDVLEAKLGIEPVGCD